MYVVEVICISFSCLLDLAILSGECRREEAPESPANRPRTSLGHRHHCSFAVGKGQRPGEKPHKKPEELYRTDVRSCKKRDYLGRDRNRLLYMTGSAPPRAAACGSKANAPTTG
jgi:hypothetical protein